MHAVTCQHLSALIAVGCGVDTVLEKAKARRKRDCEFFMIANNLPQKGVFIEEIQNLEISMPWSYPCRSWS